VVASCWGFASPWPPSPLPDYFPKKVGCGEAELVASAWGLTRPHFMARPSAQSDPVLSPTTPVVCIFVYGTCQRTRRVIFSGKSWGTDAEHLNPTTHVGEAEGNLNPHKSPLACFVL